MNMTVVTKSSLNWKFQFFGLKLPKNENIAIEFCIFELVYRHVHNVFRRFDETNRHY